ncbi:zinc finger BED domain-containing protein 4-like [Drosophila tropicalis]|uniref:zinc finger BED domain-containing protein 4-like n=1 Tax=Drosophila tropicalis TaxID=46794 RepID=UPI0035AC195F
MMKLHAKKKKIVSSVWNHFDHLKNRMYAKCRYCTKEYRTSGNTSNLMDHLKRFHSLVLQDGKNEVKVDKYFSSGECYNTTSTRKAHIDECLARMVALDLQPFSIVEDVGFKDFVKALDPKYVLPSRRTLKDVHIQNMYNNSLLKLKAIMQRMEYCSITTDSWTSRANTSYITVTVHFIDNFSLKTAVLCTLPLIDQTNHNSENIATTLRQICNEWAIYDKIQTVVTDSAPVMIKACEIFEKRHLPCFAHTLNLVVQDVLSNKNVKEVLTSAKRIVSFMKSSSIAKAKFKEEQGSSNPLNLLQEVPTRWNSAFYMLERILEVREPLLATLLKSRGAPIPLSEDQFRVIKDICTVLRPFEAATRHTSAANTVTISLIIPAILALTKSLEELLPTMLTTVGSETCALLIQKVKTKLFPYETRTDPRLGTLLDARFKKEGFQSDGNVQQTAIKLENELSGLKKLAQNQPEDEELPEDSPFLFKFMGKKVEEKRSNNRADAIIMMRQYFEQRNAAHDTDPLQFWKINESQFDGLSRCATKYLSIPASSVESERIFSKAGAIITDRRAAMKEKYVNQLIFLQKNQWINDETN